MGKQLAAQQQSVPTGCAVSMKSEVLRLLKTRMLSLRMLGKTLNHLFLRVLYHLTVIKLIHSL